MTENATLNLYTKRMSLSKCIISINAFHVVPFLGLIFFVSSLLLDSFNGGAQEAENIQMQVPLHAVFAFCRLLHRECICSHRLQRGKTYSRSHVYCINLLSISLLEYCGKFSLLSGFRGIFHYIIMDLHLTYLHSYLIQESYISSLPMYTSSNEHINPVHKYFQTQINNMASKSNNRAIFAQRFLSRRFIDAMQNTRLKTCEVCCYHPKPI